MPQLNTPVSALGLCLGLAVAALPPVAFAQSAASQQAQQQLQLNLPAGPLTQALNQLASTSGYSLSFDADLTANKTSAGLHGRYSLQQALDTLLSGTGLTYRLNADQTITLGANGSFDSSNQSALVLPTVLVQGESLSGHAANAYRVDQASVGVLGQTKLQNTPYSMEVYSRDYMDNLQARSLSDITKYDAAISLSANDLLSENNQFSIRGITPDFDTGQKIDGLNLRSRAKDLPLEHVERVEVLKGAGGFLYGFGTPGGIVNYVLKRPTDELTRSISTQMMDSGLFLLHGDIGGRFGAEDRFGYRLNLVGETGETYINDGDAERKSASVALDWRITPELTWQVDALYANRKSYGGYWSITPNSDGLDGNWAIAEPLDPIDGDKRLMPEWMLYESEHKTLGTDLLWDFADNWDMRLSYRYSSSYRYLMNPGVFADVDGNYSIQSWNYNNLFESHQTQGLITGEFVTGPVKHDVTTGLSYNKTIASNSGDLGTDLILSNVGNLSDPVDFPKTINTLSKGDAEHSEYSEVIRKEVFLSDTLHFGDNWDLILGARYGNIKDEYGDYDESDITPTLAAIYRPLEWMSLYASYIEAFQQGNVASSSAANAGEVFDPMISTQYETGIKIDQDSWGANIALFQLNQGITYTDSSNVFHQDDKARYEGLEVSAKTRLGDYWLVGASAMWLDAKDRNGDDIAGIASEQYRLYSEFDVPDSNWVITGGARYTGKRPLVSSGQWHADSITLFDLGARYELEVQDKPVSLRVNVDNLTDEAYWLTTAGSGSLTQGAPRTLRLSAQVDF